MFFFYLSNLLNVLGTLYKDWEIPLWAVWLPVNFFVFSIVCYISFLGAHTHTHTHMVMFLGPAKL